ncbi:MAG: histidine phosphatase family protein [Clostridia bacterium]|nr:histidine phosphatase family protein [Clostridia bacterium]NCC44615.1 histidine phosphatase family protein [Clostridia bacterium]
MKIYLIRHGETMGNSEERYIGRTDEPLLDEEKIRLQNKVIPKVETVFVSPMLRCRQTANLLFPKQPVRIMEELAECDFGEFENKNWKELTDDPQYQEWIDSNGTLPFPGGEDPMKFKERCCRAFAKAVSECFKEKIETAAFVIHGGTIMSILERYAVPQKEFYDWHVKNGEGYQIEILSSLWTSSRREIYQVISEKYE